MFTLKINVDKLIYNAKFLRQKAKAQLCAVLKANAYGHGFEIAKFLSDYVDSFAVASGDEAIKLRKFTVKPIYVLCPSEDIGDENVIYSAMSQNDLRHKRICVKINTGMNRLGILPQETGEFLDKCSRYNIAVESVYTHLSDDDNTPLQLSRFDNVRADVKRHAFASNFLRFDQDHYDMVRCGLSLYGYGDIELKPVLSAFASVYNVLSVKKGERIGYGISADKDMKIAVLGVGYADCIRRQRQDFFVGGRICHSVGDICMDMCFVDVSDANVKVGDNAEYLGKHICGESIAKNNGTIVYDILTSFGSRCRRIYE